MISSMSIFVDVVFVIGMDVLFGNAAVVHEDVIGFTLIVDI
tara:strand:- start:572 stop:694 length:123 start_codon:yes stop_codon:yes gene_type:complete